MVAVPRSTLWSIFEGRRFQPAERQIAVIYSSCRHLPSPPNPPERCNEIFIHIPCRTSSLHHHNAPPVLFTPPSLDVRLDLQIQAPIISDGRREGDIGAAVELTSV